MSCHDSFIKFFDLQSHQMTEILLIRRKGSTLFNSLESHVSKSAIKLHGPQHPMISYGWEQDSQDFYKRWKFHLPTAA